MDDGIEIATLLDSDITADLAGLVDGGSVDNIAYSATADGGRLELRVTDGMGGERRYELTVSEI